MKSDYKFVKKANMYVKTWLEAGKQKQDWLTKEQYEALS